MEANKDNIFIKKLIAKKKELEDCQELHKIQSCFECDKLIGCTLRNEYVKFVYESMSQGKTGEFQF